MFCEQCGAKLPDQAAFCMNCGAFIQKYSDTTQAHARPFPNQNAYGAPSYPNQDAYAARPFPDRDAYPEEPKIRTKFSWAPITLAMIALVLWAEKGGDPEINEVNMYDWISAVISAGSFLGALYLIPERRKVLRTIAIIITGLIALLIVSYALFN